MQILGVACCLDTTNDLRGGAGGEWGHGARQVTVAQLGADWVGIRSSEAVRKKFWAIFFSRPRPRRLLVNNGGINYDPLLRIL